MPRRAGAARGDGDDALIAGREDWVAVLDRHYWDPAGGGYFFAADDTPALIARAKTAADAAVPAGNGTLVGVLTRLAILTGDDAYRDRAEAIVAPFPASSARNFFPLATLLNNAELLAEAGADRHCRYGVGDSRFEALRRAVYAVSLPNRDRADRGAGRHAAGAPPGPRQRPRRRARRPPMSARARSVRCR